MSLSHIIQNYWLHCPSVLFEQSLQSPLSMRFLFGIFSRRPATNNISHNFTFAKNSFKQTGGIMDTSIWTWMVIMRMSIPTRSAQVGCEHLSHKVEKVSDDHKEIRWFELHSSHGLKCTQKGVNYTQHRNHVSPNSFENFEFLCFAYRHRVILHIWRCQSNLHDMQLYAIFPWCIFLSSVLIQRAILWSSGTQHEYTIPPELDITRAREIILH